MFRFAALLCIAIGFAAAGSPKVLWQTTIDTQDMIGYPFFANGNAYVAGQSGNSSTFYCLRETDGKVLWSHKQEGKGIYVQTGRTLAFSATEKYVYAYDQVSGTLVWKFDLSYIPRNTSVQPMTTPKPDYVPELSVLLVSVYNGPVAVIDAEYGRQRLLTTDTALSRVWHTKLDDGTPAMYYVANFIDNQKHVVCRRVADGSLVWRHAHGVTADTSAFIVVTDYGLLEQNIRVNHMEKLQSVDKNTGQTRWTYYNPFVANADFNMDGNGIFSAVQATNTSYNLIRFNTDSGAPVWKEQLATTEANINLLTAAGTAFVIAAGTKPENNWIWAYDATNGDAVWTYNVNSPYYGGVSNNALIFGSGTNLITALKVRQN